MVYQHSDYVRSTAFTTAGTLLATGGDDGRIALIELSSFTLVASWALEDYVFNVTFSPGGNVLVSSCRNGLLNVFDVKSLTEVREVQPNGEVELTTHAFSPCGSFVATGDEEGGVTISTISLADTQSKFTLGDDEEVTALSHATPPGGEPVLACATSEGRVRLLNAST